MGGLSMRAVTAFAVVALALGTTPAAAQDYPVREIKTKIGRASCRERV